MDMVIVNKGYGEFIYPCEDGLIRGAVLSYISVFVLVFLLIRIKTQNIATCVPRTII